MTIHLAIIGGGAAAVAVFTQIVDCLRSELNLDVCIKIFEPKEAVGPGSVYQDDLDSNLLNRSVETLSLFPEKPLDFLDWLNEKKLIEPNPKFPLFLKRSLFGTYLNDRFIRAFNHARKIGIDVEKVSQEIVGLEGDIKHRFLIDRGGKKYPVKAMILCLGNPPPQDLFSLKSFDHYIDHLFPTSSLIKKIPKNDRVLILGTRLTAIDTSIGLLENGHSAPVYLVSRHGQLPSVKGKGSFSHSSQISSEMIRKFALSRKEGLSLKDLYRFLRTEFGHIGEKVKKMGLGEYKKTLDWTPFFENEILTSEMNQSWKSVLASTNEWVHEAWHWLSPGDKDLFLKKYHSDWLARRVSIPMENAQKVLGFIRQEKLELKRCLKNIIPTSSQTFECLFTESPSLKVDWVLNATGPSRYLEGEPLPLIKQLLDEGIAQKSDWGGVVLDYETSQLINRNGKKEEAIWVTGHLSCGTYYFTSLFPFLVKQSRWIGKSFKDWMKTKNLPSEFYGKSVNFTDQTSYSDPFDRLEENRWKRDDSFQ